MLHLSLHDYGDERDLVLSTPGASKDIPEALVRLAAGNRIRCATRTGGHGEIQIGAVLLAEYRSPRGQWDGPWAMSTTKAKSG